jgi:hypothetical protein
MSVAIGIATSSVVAPNDGNGSASAGPCVKIIGTKATITIPWPIYRPTEYTIHPHDEGKKPERHAVEIPGKGMHWQADATARGIRKNSCISLIGANKEGMGNWKVVSCPWRKRFSSWKLWIV